MTARTLLVAGASGNLGRLVLVHLMQHAPQDRIVAGTRTPEKLGDLGSCGIETRFLDLDRRDTLPTALAGVDRMLLISTAALDPPGHRLEQHSTAIEEARRSGVKHVIYTSMPRPYEANPMVLATNHRGSELALWQSGLAHTILRNNWYMENILGGLSHAVASGTLASASGNGRVGWVSREDCARAAAAALVSHEDCSSVRDISGPELLSMADVAQVLSDVTGKTVHAVTVDTETRRSQFAAAGLPEAVASMLANSEDGMARGWLAILSDDVRTLTGMAPISFRRFLEANRKAIMPA